MLPDVQITEIDGNLGVQPAGDPYFVLVGPCDSGPLNTPAAFARTQDVVTTFGGGPLVEAACYHIATFNQPAVIVRTGNSVAATESAIDVTGITGTSVVTLGADTTANDDYEAGFVTVNGGTIGTLGITIQWTLDGFRTLSPITALGTANTFVIPGSGGVGFAFAAGTLIAGDKAFFRTVAPNWNATELGAALTTLNASTFPWDVAEIVGPIDATAFSALGVSFGAMPEKAWIGNTRIPTASETEGTYKTALDGIFSNLATTFGDLCAGAAWVTSGVTFRQYLRPISHAVAPLTATVSPEIDISAIDNGLLVGVRIRDANGNPVSYLHDERNSPGLDDSRFTTLRTWDGVQGVYVTNSRLFSPAGSDFQWFQHRRILNLLKRTTRIYFQRRLSKPIAVDTNTGFILESEAVAIETAANAAIRSVLMTVPMVSGGAFGKFNFVKVNRSDNLLSGNSLRIQEGVVPLFYPKKFIINTGFNNPIVNPV